MHFLLTFLAVQFSIGVFADPMAQGASLKFNLREKLTFSVVLSGRQGERLYSAYIERDTEYATVDTIGDFYWVKNEFRFEYPLGFKRGIMPYVVLGLGGNAEKYWLFNEQDSTWKSYKYWAVGGLTGVGLNIYPFTFLSSLFNTQSKFREQIQKVEEDFTLQLELINVYYRRFKGDRPLREYLYEYNNAGVGMGIGFYYNF